jgi:hypothetical protein
MVINVRDYLSGAPDPYNRAQSEEELLRQQQADRNAYLDQISGRAPAFRQRELENTAIAGAHASAGGLLTPGGSPFALSRDANEAYRREQDILDAMDQKRAGNVDSDADRLRMFVRNSIKDEQQQEEFGLKKDRFGLDKEKHAFAMESGRANLDMRQQEFGLDQEKQKFAMESGRAGLDMRQQEFGLRKEELELKLAKAKGLGDPIKGLKTGTGQLVFNKPGGGGWVGADGVIIDPTTVVRDTRFDKPSSALNQATGQRVYKDQNTGKHYVLRTVGTQPGLYGVDDGDKFTGDQRDLVEQKEATAGGIAQSKELGKAEGEAEIEMVAQSRGAHKTKTQLRDIRSALNGITGGTGPLTDNWITKNAAGAVEQVTGYDPLQMKDRQVAQSSIRQMVLDRRAQMKGQGTITDSESKIIDDLLPQLGNTQAANDRIMEILERGADRSIKKEREWRKAKSTDTNLSYDNWDFTWRERVESENTSTTKGRFDYLRDGNSASTGGLSAAKSKYGL